MIATAVAEILADRRSLGIDSIPGWPWGRRSIAGVSVTENTALNLSPVWAAVRLLAGDVASLPLQLFRRLPNGGKTLADDHPLYEVLHDQTNTELTAFDWRHLMQTTAEIWGNAYARIERRNGLPVALWPIPSDQVAVERVGNRLGLQYRITGETEPIPGKDMLHLRGGVSNWDGMMGLSPVKVAMESIGVALSMQEFAARFFSQGTAVGVYIRHPKRLSEAAKTNLKASFEQEAGGLRGAHRPQVLEEDMDVKSLTMPLESAQFVETRKFQVTEIARVFGIPPPMLFDLERATFTNIEQQAIDYVVNALLPRCRRWEAEFRFKLVGEAERRMGFFAAFNLEGRLRGDQASRYTAYQIAKYGGWMSTNDIRRLENMDPIEDGDDYWQPANMLIVGEERPMPAAAAPAQIGNGNGGRPALVRARALLDSLEGAYRYPFESLAAGWTAREARNVLALDRTSKGDPGRFWLQVRAYHGALALRVEETALPVMRAYADAVRDGLLDFLPEGSTVDLSGVVARAARDAGVRYATRAAETLPDDRVALAAYYEQRQAEAAKLAAAEQRELGEEVVRAVLIAAGLTPAVKLIA